MGYENMVQYKDMKKLPVMMLLALGAPFAAMAARVVVAPMPESPFADTEVSTNVAVNTWRNDTRQMELNLQLDGTPSNNLEVAFGRDSNGDGVLGIDETDAVYGWRGGRYFVENVRGWERFESVAATNAPCGVCRFLVRNDADVVPRRFSAVCDGEAAFPELDTVPPPSWLYRREWNLARVTRRGVGTPSEWVRCDIVYTSFLISIR